MADWLGWTATAVFASSYLTHSSVALRRVQALAAILWIAYGVLIHAAPVIVANVVVAAIAFGTTFAARRQPAGSRTPTPTPPPPHPR
jgi:hypothetical protein